MPIIAPQHKWKDTDFSPSCAWPDDTRVQWGSRGIVLGKNPYRTAFFEAFPSDESKTGGFIRGEGNSLAEAEQSAFNQFLRQLACNHYWGRERYRNSGQLCRHCRAFRSGFVKPITELGTWRMPISRSGKLILDLEEERPTEEGKRDLRPGSGSYLRKLYLRKKYFGVKP